MPQQLAILDTLNTLSAKFPHSRTELRSILELRQIARGYDGPVRKALILTITSKIIALRKELSRLTKN